MVLGETTELLISPVTANVLGIIIAGLLAALVALLGFLGRMQWNANCEFRESIETERQARKQLQLKMGSDLEKMYAYMKETYVRRDNLEPNMQAINTRLADINLIVTKLVDKLSELAEARGRNEATVEMMKKHGWGDK